MLLNIKYSFVGLLIFATLNISSAVNINKNINNNTKYNSNLSIKDVSAANHLPDKNDALISKNEAEGITTLNSNGDETTLTETNKNTNTNTNKSENKKINTVREHNDIDLPASNEIELNKGDEVGISGKATNSNTNVNINKNIRSGATSNGTITDGAVGTMVTKGEEADIGAAVNSNSNINKNSKTRNGALAKRILINSPEKNKYVGGAGSTSGSASSNININQNKKIRRGEINTDLILDGAASTTFKNMNLAKILSTKANSNFNFNENKNIGHGALTKGILQAGVTRKGFENAGAASSAFDSAISNININKNHNLRHGVLAKGILIGNPAIIGNERGSGKASGSSNINSIINKNKNTRGGTFNTGLILDAAKKNKFVNSAAAGISSGNTNSNTNVNQNKNVRHFRLPKKQLRETIKRGSANTFKKGGGANGASGAGSSNLNVNQNKNGGVADSVSGASNNNNLSIIKKKNIIHDGLILYDASKNRFKNEGVPSSLSTSGNSNFNVNQNKIRNHGGFAKKVFVTGAAGMGFQDRYGYGNAIAAANSNFNLKQNKNIKHYSFSEMFKSPARKRFRFGERFVTPYMSSYAIPSGNFASEISNSANMFGSLITNQALEAAKKVSLSAAQANLAAQYNGFQASQYAIHPFNRISYIATYVPNLVNSASETSNRPYFMHYSYGNNWNTNINRNG